MGVLARLVPIDLWLAHFEIGQTARAMLGHLNVAITRKDAQDIETMVMRSMTGALVHQLQTARRGVAAR